MLLKRGCFFRPKKGTARCPAEGSAQRRTRFFRLPGKKLGELRIGQFMAGGASACRSSLSPQCGATGFVAASPTIRLSPSSTVRIHNESE